MKDKLKLGASELKKKPTIELRERNYKEKLLKNYYQTHYQYIIPKSEKEMSNVLDLIHINMSRYFLDLKKNALILDAGCGVGYLEQYLINNGFNNIHAIDISPQQIEVAKNYMAKKGIKYDGKVQFKNIDIFEEFENNDLKYDIITFIDVLEHFKKYEAFELLELAYEALNQNGTILIRVPNMEDPIYSSLNFYHDFTHEIGFTRSSLKQCIIGTGFEKPEANFEKSKSFLNLPPIHKKFLGLLLGTSSNSITTNIIGVGRKQ